MGGMVEDNGDGGGVGKDEVERVAKGITRRRKGTGGGGGVGGAGGNTAIFQTPRRVGDGVGSPYARFLGSGAYEDSPVRRVGRGRNGRDLPEHVHRALGPHVHPAVAAVVVVHRRSLSRVVYT